MTSLVQIMACRLAGTKPLSEPMKGTNFNEIFIKIQQFFFQENGLKMSSAKWRPFCLGLNMLKEKETLHSLAGLLNIYISGIWLWYMQALFINRVKQNRCLKSENPQPMVVTILPPCSGKQMWMWCSVVSSLLDGSLPLAPFQKLPGVNSCWEQAN